MQQKHKPQLDCGVDGINIIFSSIYETEQDVYHFVRNECNKKIEYATLKKIKVTNECIFRKNRALAPHERSAVPLGTDHCPVC